MNNYQYLISMAAEGDNKASLITLGFFICIAIVVYLFFRFSASGGEEYIEVSNEDKDGELHLPEDIKYRVDWLNVLMNYVILSYGRMSDEPNISAFKPKDGVSVLRITDKKIQFSITVYWSKHKVSLTGFIMPTEVCGDIQTIRHSFKWKGYEVPYTEVDKFLTKFMDIEEDLVLTTIEDNISQKEVNKLLIQELIHMALNEELVLPKDNPMDLMMAAICGLLGLIPKLKKETLDEYLTFLSVLVTYFAKDYGKDWLQKFSFEPEIIEDLLKQINSIEDCDEAASTAEEEDD